MTYTIDNKIPIPMKGDSKYPLKKMEIGDSFQFPMGEKSKIYSSMYGYMKKHPPVKFVIDGQRCWRSK